MTLTTEQLASAAYLNCSMSTVYRLASTGRIPYLKVGAAYRFDWDDVKAALTPTKVDPWVNPRRRSRL